MNMTSHMKMELKGFENNPLKFTIGNAKLDGIITFSLPAGHSCPFAKECSSRTVLRENGQPGYCIKDGFGCKFRCFAAIDEAIKPIVRKYRWHNFLSLKRNLSTDPKAAFKLFSRSIPNSKWAPIRMHVSGDFFSQTYFDMVLEYAKQNRKKLIYAYTKALPFWVKRLKEIPDNFRLTASYGGTHDHLIEKHGLKSALVVFSVEEAMQKGLEIDHDDSLAYEGNKSFALLLHGTQPPGTPANDAWQRIKKNEGGYSKGKKRGGTTPSMSAAMSIAA